MTITCIRHLESIANTRMGFCYKDNEQRLELNLPGDNDVPLTSTGVEHVHRLQKELAKIPIFDSEEMDFYVSPYLKLFKQQKLFFLNTRIDS